MSTQGEGLALAHEQMDRALTIAEQWALKSAILKYKQAKGDHERAAAEKEVLEALDKLEKSRKAAGLDK